VKQERSYSPEQVVRLLNNYLDFRFTLVGEGAAGSPTTYTAPDEHYVRPMDRPFGMTATDRREWPFMGMPHAKPPRDGKAKAKQIQEIHISIIDLDAALERLDDDELELIYKYHLFQTRTLEELCIERNTNRWALTRQIERAVRRLARLMEQPYR
jgi:hypothetical protein